MLQANFGSLFRLKGQAFVKLLRELLADAKSTPSYSSGLHLSVFQGKSKRGAFKMFEKYVLKISTISNNAENGICPIKKVVNDAICPINCNLRSDNYIIIYNTKKM